MDLKDYYYYNNKNFIIENFYFKFLQLFSNNNSLDLKILSLKIDNIGCEKELSTKMNFPLSHNSSNNIGDGKNPINKYDADKYNHNCYDYFNQTEGDSGQYDRKTIDKENFSNKNTYIGVHYKGNYVNSLGTTCSVGFIDTNKSLNNKNNVQVIATNSKDNFKRNVVVDNEANNISFPRNIMIEDFEFIKVIGKGHFGKVSQVRFKPDGNIYALKSLKKEKLIEAKDLEHTKLERKILANLNHPFIIKLKYAFQNLKKLYLVMEYHNGGELFYHMKSKDTLTEEEAKFYISQIVLVIEFLHTKKIIYRDLKPENIILDRLGYIKLTDFGLAKDEVNSESVAETLCGTRDYLAPEIVKGEKYGKSVDIWSMGVLLYEMLFGVVFIFYIFFYVVKIINLYFFDD